jgi:hypothetical protein
VPFTPTREVRIRWPELPLVLEEIVAKLLADDWCRCLAEDGQRSYYIVGIAAHEAHVFGDEAYPISEYPRECPSDLLEEAFVRSQIPRRYADYLPRVREDLERAGVSPAAIDRAIDRIVAGEVGGEGPFEGWRWSEFTTPDQRVELLGRFLSVLLVSISHRRSEVVPLVDEESLQVDVTREKLCLREVSKLYQKIVRRWEQLEPLTFHDPQLEEASRAYLYGFYRATVVLSTCALETLLRRLTGTEKIGKALVDEAQERGVLGGDAADWTMQVFGVRNRVVHEGWPPEADDAKQVLGIARTILRDARGAP